MEEEDKKVEDYRIMIQAVGIFGLWVYRLIIILIVLNIHFWVTQVETPTSIFILSLIATSISIFTEIAKIKN